VDNKKYDLWVRILAVLMVLVLVVGVVFSLEKPKLSVVEINNPSEDVITTEAYISVIDTKAPDDYFMLLGNISRLRSEYSDLIRVYTLGNTATGKAIPMLTVGNGEKKALVTGAIHAREHLTTKYLLCCIDEFCYTVEKGSGRIGDFDVKKLFDEYTLYVVPCINPDGLQIVLSQQSIKKGVSVDKLTDYKANYNGVDLNRNFPVAWNAIDNGVTKPSGYFFKGYKSASEKETQYLMNLCEANAFEFLLSVHVKGNCIFWGDTYNTKLNSVYKAFATDISKATDLFVSEPTKKASSYGGGFENWFRHKYSRPGLCIELVDNEIIINPCTKENYIDFYSTVNFDKTKFVILSALASENK
jgi:g-D-glutamyl-meso-diaminopimelate peptidase